MIFPVSLSPATSPCQPQCHKSVILHSPDYFTPHFLEVSHSQHITNFPGKRLNSAKNFGKIAFKWDGGWLYLGWNEIKMFRARTLRDTEHGETETTLQMVPGFLTWWTICGLLVSSRAIISRDDKIKRRSSWAINSMQDGDSLQNYRHTSQINILFSICVSIKCSMKGAGIKSRLAGAGLSRTLPLRHFTFHVHTLPCLSYCHFNINFRTFKLSKWWNIFQVLLVKLA